jgi:energy-coupling factor transporter transmembrane protein EcfT
MIILGVILLILGYLLAIPVLVTIGWVVAGVGLVLLLIAVVGQREIGGKRYWF